MRRAWWLFLLAGCDQIYGLHDRPHMDAPGDVSSDVRLDGVVDGVDDDGDGVPNDQDPCPHIAHQSDVDGDGDGISRECDSNDEELSQHVYLSLVGGVITPLDLVSGSGGGDGNGFVLGSKTTRFDALALAVDASYVDIEVRFEMRENSIDNQGDPGFYAEMGLFAGNHDFVDHSERGNVCFFGRSKAPQPDQVYLEIVENDGSSITLGNLPTPLNGVKGTLRMHRTPTRWDCTLKRDGQTTANGDEVTTDSGRIGISAERTAVWIDSIWIAYD